MHRSRIVRWAVAAALAAVAGCGPDFDAQFEILDRPRIVAIRATPVTLKPGQIATIDALVANPEERPISYDWSWCPFRTSAEDGYRCPVTRDELAALLTTSAPDGVPPEALDALIPPLELGDGPEAVLPYPLPSAEATRAVCDALQGVLAGEFEGTPVPDDVLIANCTYGYEIQLRLELRVEGVEPMIATKRVTLFTGSEQDVNRNPSVETIEIRVPGAARRAELAGRLPWIAQAGNDGWYAAPAGAPTELADGVTYEIRAQMAPDASELFTRPAPRGTDSPGGRLPEEREALDFDWFTSAGSLDPTEALYAPGINELEEASVVEFEPERAGPVTLHVVVNDARLGVGFVSRDFVVSP